MVPTRRVYTRQKCLISRIFLLNSGVDGADHEQFICWCLLAFIRSHLNLIETADSYYVSFLHPVEEFLLIVNREPLCMKQLHFLLVCDGKRLILDVLHVKLALVYDV